jgi:hypothetical protein
VVKQKRISIVIACVVMFVLAAWATDVRSQIAPIDAGDFEVGLILGEPTGLSAKLWATGNTAFDLGVAWSFGDGGHFHIHGDYLFHNFSFFDVNSGSLPVYVGIGGRVRLQEDDSRVGLRIPIGLEYILESAPVGFFFEVVPIVDFAPETEADVNGGIGVRYIF